MPTYRSVLPPTRPWILARLHNAIHLHMCTLTDRYDECDGKHKRTCPSYGYMYICGENVLYILILIPI